MIYYKGPYQDAVLVADDVQDNCPDLLVGLMPFTHRAIAPDRRGEWAVIIAMPEETPMLEVFSFTDEKLRTFQWGLEDDRGETSIICKVSQNYSTTYEFEGETRIRGQMIFGKGVGPTAQIAYDAALASLTEEMKKAVVQ